MLIFLNFYKDNQLHNDQFIYLQNRKFDKV